MKKYIGSKDFYKKMLLVMIPILVQNLITSFVNLLDNIMVGQIGTEPMSGVAIVNQLLFVFNLCIFGGLAGAGIFSAQFYGNKDEEGVQYTFRIKNYIALIFVVVSGAALMLFSDMLISLFLHEGDGSLNLASTMGYAKEYLSVMYFGLLPFAAVQSYASTLRETGETMLPMKAGLTAVFLNMVLNYILIFGKLGIPALGVRGAAIATVISRWVEFLIVVVWTHRHTEKNRFIVGAYRSLYVPAGLLRQVCISGAPPLLNEFLFSMGLTVMNQCYSTKGLEVVSAVNISSTVWNLFMCVFFAMGSAVSIMVGQQLGSGDLEGAVDTDRKLIAFSVALGVVIGAVMFLLAPLIPAIYNTTDTVKHLAAIFLEICAVLVPVHAFNNCAYFTLRSGGKTIVTFIFDSCYLWVVSIPAVYLLARLTDLPIIPIYFVGQITDLLKIFTGVYLLRKRTWVNNLSSANAK